MAYTVRISDKAKKSVENLPPDYKKTIREVLEGLQINPYPHGSIRLEGRPNCHRIRVGPFRIQYAVLENDNAILIFKISRRDETTYK